MKQLQLKNAFLATSVLSVLGYAGSASAHDQSGTLGVAATATDYYQVSCYDDGNGSAQKLAVQIKDAAPVAAPIVSIQVVKGRKASNSTDAVDGNAAYSPLLNITGGDGDYNVTVSKTAAGAETYTFQFHCVTSGGDHTGTDIAVLQNQ